MATFNPDRADAIREQLINHAAEKPGLRHRILLAIGLVVAGAVAGAGISAGAFAASGTLTFAQPSGMSIPDLPPAVSAPPGVTPGEPIIALLGQPLSLNVDALLEISLEDRPAAATHARVTITPTSAGHLTFGTDPGGNNPSGSWNDADINNEAYLQREPSTWYDFPLDDTVTTLFLTPTGFTGIVTVQFVTHVPTTPGVNENGETFGSGGADSPDGTDLVAVIGTAPDGTQVEGYARSSDLNAFGPDHPGQPQNPDEALRWQEERDAKYPNGWDIPVFTSDGTTQIGVFHISN